jgi:hypothetical protein
MLVYGCVYVCGSVALVWAMLLLVWSEHQAWKQQWGQMSMLMWSEQQAGKQQWGQTSANPHMARDVARVLVFL